MCLTFCTTLCLVDAQKRPTSPVIVASQPIIIGAVTHGEDLNDSLAAAHDGP